MVKLDGPCMSMGARGTLGKTLTFAKNRKTAYAKKHFIPANPKTAGQLGVRMMVTFLTQIWSTLTEADKSSWTPFAELYGLSNYHAYLKENCRRWALGLLPAKNTPIITGAATLDFSGWYTGTPGNFVAECNSNGPAAIPFILQICIMDDIGETPSKNNTVALVDKFTWNGTNWVSEWKITDPDITSKVMVARQGYPNGVATEFEQLEYQA